MITRTTDTDLTARTVAIFDFDGTLADTMPAIVRTATRVLTEWGLDEAEAAARAPQLVGPPFPDAFTLVYGLPRADAEEVTRRYRAIYNQLGLEAWPLFPGTREALQALRASGRTVAVATSKPDHLVRTCIADNAADDLFDLVVGKVDGEVDTKGQAITAVMARLGARPEDCVMVGDRFHDVDGAREAGIPCVGVTWGGTGTRAELEGAGAAAVVDTLAELVEALLGA